MAKWTMQRDPAVYARGVARKPACSYRALGLDFGTRCGSAFLDFVPGQPLVEQPMYLDILDLSIGTYDTGALRLLRLRQFLDIINPDMLFFENVKFTPSKELVATRKLGIQGIVARVATAAEFLGLLKGCVTQWAAERDIPAQGFGIGAIKQRATGKGNAGKAAVVAACNAEFGTNFDTETCEDDGTDDIADAAWCLVLGLEGNVGGARGQQESLLAGNKNDES